MLKHIGVLPVWAGLLVLMLMGCTAPMQQTGPSVSGMKLTRAVLYQNGIGYFERQGKVDGNKVTVRIRADQVNDFLKSLTVIDTSNGKAVSVSLPLDRHAAAHVMELAGLLEESIELPDLLVGLKGTTVTLRGKRGTASGRIISVDEIATDTELDWRVSVMGERAIETMLLSDLLSMAIGDEFIVLGLHKGLDAVASGGVFKVVDVTVNLDRAGRHDLLLSYVVACPAWKPSYRLVLGEDGKALLQGWAVVDNVTGEAWDNIQLSLTSGAPIAFKYDLYAPRFVERPDLSHVSRQKVARAAVGETSYDDIEAEEELAAPMESSPPPPSRKRASRKMKRSKQSSASTGYAFKPNSMVEKESERGAGAGGSAGPGMGASPSVSMENLQASAQAMVKASRASGAVRYDMQEPVVVPDRSAALVAILNQTIPGEEAFLFTPQGAGQGFEQNPYRVVRFENNTGFILEPGPISIYSGGTFVGEGIGETISSGKRATIPFAVDPSIMVTADRQALLAEARLVKIHGGVMTVESFDRVNTRYTVKGGPSEGFRLYVRHNKAGGRYAFKDEPKGTEDLGSAYLVPIDVEKNQKETSYTVIEQTPVKQSLTIWNSSALVALELYLKGDDAISKENREKLTTILEKRQRIAVIDTKMSHLTMKRNELDERMRQTRENLIALKKNKAAGALKAKLAKKLDGFSDESDAVSKELVALTDERLELKVGIDEQMEDLTLTTSRSKTGKGE